MNQRVKRYLQHPIIGKVIILNQYLMRVRTLPSKDMRNVYVQSMLSSAEVLFMQAMREVRGKEYLKRAIETIEEITAKNYLIFALHGWNNDVCARIDALCEEITEDLYKIDAAVKRQNH